MLFWIVTIALALIVAALLALAALRGGREAAPAAAYDLKVYRDQLAEVERDLARGVIGAAEAERLRTEISRRILEADRAAGAAGAQEAPRRLSPVALAAIGLALAVAFGVYWRIGVPGYPDMPIAVRIADADERHATRPSQAEAEADAAASLPAPLTPDAQYAELVERLRATVAERPDDPVGLSLLARNEAALGNFAAARAAQERVLALKGAQATAEDHAALADTMVMAAGGYVSPEAEAAAVAALERDPRNGTARFYMGLMLAQIGRPDLGFPYWRALLEEGPEAAPWIAPIREQIELLAAAAGVNYAAPPPREAAPGPSAADVEAAGQLSAEDREAMIRSMVEGLADRLATQGGSAEDWGRLIGALGILGERDRAAAIWGEAQQVFSGREADLAVVRAAAERAGVAE